LAVQQLEESLENKTVTHEVRSSLPSIERIRHITKLLQVAAEWLSRVGGEDDSRVIGRLLSASPALVSILRSHLSLLLQSHATLLQAQERDDYTLLAALYDKFLPQLSLADVEPFFPDLFARLLPLQLRPVSNASRLVAQFLAGLPVPLFEGLGEVAGKAEKKGSKKRRSEAADGGVAVQAEPDSSTAQPLAHTLSSKLADNLLRHRKDLPSNLALLRSFATAAAPSSTPVSYFTLAMLAKAVQQQADIKGDSRARMLICELLLELLQLQSLHLSRPLPAAPSLTTDQLPHALQVSCAHTGDATEQEHHRQAVLLWAAGHMAAALPTGVEAPEDYMRALIARALPPTSSLHLAERALVLLAGLPLAADAKVPPTLPHLVAVMSRLAADVATPDNLARLLLQNACRALEHAENGRVERAARVAVTCLSLVRVLASSLSAPGWLASIACPLLLGLLSDAAAPVRAAAYAAVLELSSASGAAEEWRPVPLLLRESKSELLADGGHLARSFGAILSRQVEQGVPVAAALLAAQGSLSSLLPLHPRYRSAIWEAVLSFAHESVYSSLPQQLEELCLAPDTHPLVESALRQLARPEVAALVVAHAAAWVDLLLRMLQSPLASMAISHLSADILSKLGEQDIRRLLHVLVLEVPKLEPAAATRARAILQGARLPLKVWTGELSAMASASLQQLSFFLELLLALLPSLESPHALLQPSFALITSLLDGSSDTPYSQPYVLQLLLRLIGALTATRAKHPAKLASQYDVAVICRVIQRTDSPAVHKESVDVLAQIGVAYPDVLAPLLAGLFSDLAAASLRHDDAYSYRLLLQMTDKLVRLLVRDAASATQQRTASVLASFVSQLASFPPHKRSHLFSTLAQAIGLDRLHILLALLSSSHYCKQLASGAAPATTTTPVPTQASSSAVQTTQQQSDGVELGVAICQQLLGSLCEVLDAFTRLIGEHLGQPTNTQLVDLTSLSPAEFGRIRVSLRRSVLLRISHPSLPTEQRPLYRQRIR
jgi:hypothetical protein